MTTKADFNAEEWAAILDGPPMAGLMVIAAERGGTIRESVSMARAYGEAREHAGGHELFDEIVAANPLVDPSGFQGGDDPRAAAAERLRKAVETLERKAPADEVDAYKQFVQQLAQAVASSHKEGGVLGLGGKPISDNEQAALDEIAKVLETGPA